MIRHNRRVLGVDANLQKEQARTRVQETETTVAQDREAADKAARTRNAAKAALDQVPIPMPQFLLCAMGHDVLRNPPSSDTSKPLKRS